MILDFKKVFFIDAVGALSSAVIIGLALPQVTSLIGMPTQMLYFLAAIALAYSAYSFVCYRFVQPARRFLVTIMVANSLYCVLTASIVAIHLDQMTKWGILYFVAEILVIFLLVTIERNVLRKIVT